MDTRQITIDALPIALAAHEWFGGASADTLWRMARRGDLKLIKVAGRTYVERREAKRAQRKRTAVERP
jgi:hypothetical protein